jgi:hypothetical protein
VTAASTLLVLNEGAVGNRKSDRFDAILADSAVREAVEEGASVVRMPELHLDQGRVGEIVNLRAFAEGNRDEAKPLSFAPFSRVLALG